LEVNPVRVSLNTPVVVPPSPTQLVDGLGLVPQQVPRTDIAAGIPRDVTLAPRIAPVCVIETEVGVVTVGLARIVTVTLPEPVSAFTRVAPVIKKQSINKSILIVFILLVKNNNQIIY